MRSTRLKRSVSLDVHGHDRAIRGEIIQFFGIAPPAWIGAPTFGYNPLALTARTARFEGLHIHLTAARFRRHVCDPAIVGGIVAFLGDRMALHKGYGLRFAGHVDVREPPEAPVFVRSDRVEQRPLVGRPTRREFSWVRFQ